MIKRHPNYSFSSQNQFLISGLDGDEILRNRVLDALFRRILRAEKEKKMLRVIIVIPLLPGFQVIIFLYLFCTPFKKIN